MKTKAGRESAEAGARFESEWTEKNNLKDIEKLGFFLLEQCDNVYDYE